MVYREKYILEQRGGSIKPGKIPLETFLTKRKENINPANVEPFWKC